MQIQQQQQLLDTSNQKSERDIFESMLREDDKDSRNSSFRPEDRDPLLKEQHQFLIQNQQKGFELEILYGNYFNPCKNLKNSSSESSLSQEKSSFHQSMDCEDSEEVSFKRKTNMENSEQEDIIPHDGCNCRKSNCLKLYCVCFQNKLFCNQTCNCIDCGNSVNNKDHKKAIIQALSRNPVAFDRELNSQQGFREGRFRLDVQQDQIRKGCRCKKTRCLKNYCWCLSQGLKCSQFCKCQNCLNRVFSETVF